MMPPKGNLPWNRRPGPWTWLALEPWTWLACQKRKAVTKALVRTLMKHRVETVMEIIAKRVMNKPYENSDEHQAKTRPTNPSENLPGEFLEAVSNSVFTMFGGGQKFTRNPPRFSPRFSRRFSPRVSSRSPPHAKVLHHRSSSYRCAPLFQRALGSGSQCICQLPLSLSISASRCAVVVSLLPCEQRGSLCCCRLTAASLAECITVGFRTKPEPLSPHCCSPPAPWSLSLSLSLSFSA